ncbi:MAG TPA: ribonuclease P protein component [Bdellovibrionales bacterium]|nr:ribonuclease P protein component [Bdellovibrionales bacterium]
MAENNKIQVLRRRSDFLALKAKGRRIRPSKWLLINYKPNDLGHVRCGWTIPKKVGKAVVRNKLKRWCRECVRKFTSADVERGLDLNIVILNDSDTDFFKRIKYAEFKEALERGLRSLS